MSADYAAIFWELIRIPFSHVELVWGIVPRKIKPGRTSHELTLNGDRIMRQEGRLKAGDRIVQIAGTIRQSGLTNPMSIREM